MLNHNRLRLGGELESAHNRSHALVSLDVRFGSLADILQRGDDVRFAPEGGHVQCTRQCPLCANSGHRALFDHLVGE